MNNTLTQLEVKVGDFVVLAKPYCGYWYGTVEEVVGGWGVALRLTAGQCGVGKSYFTSVDTRLDEVMMVLDTAKTVLEENGCEHGFGTKNAHRGYEAGI